MNIYRERTFSMMDQILRPYGPFGDTLDFGCGDGWFTSRMKSEGLARRIVPLDVVRREKSYADTVLYSGESLPFEDQAFDLVYAIDVLHHCPDPANFLREITRCSRRWLLIKDHTYQSFVGWLALCALDELGNRRFSIPSLYKYQRQWEWLPLIEDQGFERVDTLYPAPCHRGLLGSCTNSLQFIGLWRKS